MTITLNGDPRTLTRAVSVTAMLDELALPAALVLVELNGKALRRSEWDQTAVRDGDIVEILRVAAGG